VLLRESYREGGKVKTRTLTNLTGWPDAQVEALRRVLKGETVIFSRDALQIERALPHGHVAAVLGMARKLKLDKLLPQAPSRLTQLALAMIVARVIEPAAKLATARQLKPRARRPIRWARCWSLARWMRTSFMPRSIFWARPSQGWRRLLPSATFAMAASFCTI
jgi:hypothetical protein